MPLGMIFIGRCCDTYRPKPISTLYNVSESELAASENTALLPEIQATSPFEIANNAFAPIEA
jgi:hypothetical protein